MRLKKELYQKEQEEYADKIVSLLPIDTDGNITLHQIDNDSELQQTLMGLIPTLRKYFSFNNMKALGCPEKLKRPYLGLIRSVTKDRYEMKSYDHRIRREGEEIIRTKKYVFVKKEQGAI